MSDAGSDDEREKDEQTKEYDDTEGMATADVTEDSSTPGIAEPGVDEAALSDRQVEPAIGDTPGDAENVEEYAAPISARPPKVVAQEESHVEVSASPAFQCLDEVLHIYYRCQIFE